MDYILNLFTKNELLIIGGVIGSLILIVLILTIWDFLSRKRRENKELSLAFSEFDKVEDNVVENTKESCLETLETEVSKTEVLDESKNSIETLEMIEDFTPIKKIDKKENVPKIENLEPVIEKNIVETPLEPLIMDIEEDNVVVDSKLEKQEKAKQELLEIEKSLSNPISLEDTLYNLEAIEEENAIISYQELLENTKELNVVNTDSGDEPISLKEILNMYETPVEEVNIENEMSTTSINDAYQGDFTSTPYLSPISGLESDTNQLVKDLAEIQLENTANLEKLDKEIRKTNEFLTILNDLKKNLD